MTPRRTHNRRGYTLFELIVVMVILIIIATIAIPSTSALYGDTRVKGAADQVRGELATARAYAMEEGRPFRVAISADGTRIRRGPDTEFADLAAADRASALASCVEYAFENVTATVTIGPENLPANAETSGGWITVAVVMHDGTCRDDGTGNTLVTVSLRELGAPPESPAIQVVVQGITGQVRVVTPGKGGMK